MNSALRMLFFSSIWLLSSVSLAGQTARSPAPPSSDAGLPAPAALTKESDAKRDPEVLIGSGDLLVVEVYGAPDYKHEVRVSSGGDVFLPMVGAIHVAGLSVHDAEQLVAKRLLDGGFFADPQVSIFEKELATQGISVLGEVQKPGIYPLLGSHTLFDVISVAGGTTPKAGTTVTLTHRGQNNAAQTVPLTYKSEDSAHSNIRVQPGDTVVVSKAGVVYVVGDVKQPTGIIMDKPRLTVLQALAMAQGANPTAALNSSKLVRRTPDGPKEIPIPLRKVLSAKAEDITLQPEDILFVPTSAAKSAVRRGLEAILQAATGVTVYHPW